MIASALFYHLVDEGARLLCTINLGTSQIREEGHSAPLSIEELSMRLTFVWGVGKKITSSLIVCVLLYPLVDDGIGWIHATNLSASRVCEECLSTLLTI